MILVDSITIVKEQCHFGSGGCGAGQKNSKVCLEYGQNYLPRFLELILLLVPVPDFCRCCVVCKDWHELVQVTSIQEVLCVMALYASSRGS